MDPVRNPYSPGAGNPPPALAGRDKELNAFSIALQRMEQGRTAKSVLLTGLRGVGKTVLLQEFGKIARSHQWDCQQLEATEDLDLAEAMAALTRKTLLRLSASKRASVSVQRALSVLKSFQLRWQLPGGDLTVGLDPFPGHADSGMLDVDLAGLFTELGNTAKSHNTGVVFTIDELQYLSKDDLGALIVALHRVSQEQLPFMVAGAGLPSLPALAGEAKSYAERLFNFPIVDSLTTADAIEAIRGPGIEEGIDWETDALDLLIDVTQGYPYFLQEFAKQAWDVAPGTTCITIADITSAIPIALDELDTGFFRVRIDRTTDTERSYLRAMATFPTGPKQSGDIAHVLGRTTSQVGPVRDSLVKRGLVFSPRWGEIDFTVPMFDAFIQRRLA